MRIVAYIYRADMYCPPCIVKLLDSKGWTGEIALDELAHEQGINRHDESTYDSGDFPKVVFSLQLENKEQCGNCGIRLRR